MVYKLITHNLKTKQTKLNPHILNLKKLTLVYAHLLFSRKHVTQFA
jgi:hypothetical protein